MINLKLNSVHIVLAFQHRMYPILDLIFIRGYGCLNLLRNPVILLVSYLSMLCSNSNIPIFSKSVSNNTVDRTWLDAKDNICTLRLIKIRVLILALFWAVITAFEMTLRLSPTANSSRRSSNRLRILLLANSQLI